MPWLVKKSGGKQWVPDDQFKEAVESGFYEVPADATVTLRDDSGQATQASAEDAAQLLEGPGYRGETGAELYGREEQARIEEEHGGILGGAKAAALEFAGTASLGQTDIVGSVLGGEDFRTERKELRKAHEGLSTAAGVAGYVVPTLLTGGTGTLGSIARATPVAMAEKFGQRIIKSGLGKGFGSQVARSAAGLGVEGALVGAGEAFSEEALLEDPFEMERFAGNLGSNVLYGGAVGGGVGVFAKAATKGAQKAKKLADDAAESLRKRSAASATGEISEDLASLDKAGLRQAKDAAKEELGTDVAASMRASYDNETDAMFKALSDADKKVLADTRGGRGWIRRHLDDPKGIAENPNILAKSLRKEEELLRKVIDDEAGNLAKLSKADSATLAKIEAQVAKMAPDDAGNVLLKGDMGDLFGNVRGIKVSRKKGVSVGRAKLEEFVGQVKAGAAADMRAGALSKLPDALESNLALQAQITGIRKGTAPRLAEIQAAEDAFGAVAKKGTVQQMAETGITGAALGVLSPVVGFTGAGLLAGKASDAISGLVFGRMAKAGAEAGKRTSDAIAKLLDAGAKVGRATPPLATKILASTSFGPAISKEPAKKTLLSSYKAREEEIHSQTTMGPNGPTMRPEARAAVAERLSGVRAVSPVLADQIETVANRKLGFLSSKLPKRPDFMAGMVGPDTWQPSNMAMRTFARYVAAVEDPGGVEERLADGTLSPEDAEAYRTVYPERYRRMQQQIIEQLPELRATLPYAKRLSLSIFSGVAVDPALDPRIFRQYQAQFDYEPGSEGGTQAPTAQPQFGSIKQPEPTDAQERAG